MKPPELHELFTAWLETFVRRPDLEWLTPPRVEAPEKRAPKGLPPDAAAFASRTRDVWFSYLLAGEDDGGRLALSLTARPLSLAIDIPHDTCVDLDCDREGVGRAGFLLSHGDAWFVVWDVEDSERFPSFTAYLTLGMRRAFTHGWQRDGGEESYSPNTALYSLRARSLPADTPADALRERLTAHLDARMADGLIALLGPDARLLFAA